MCVNCNSLLYLFQLAFEILAFTPEERDDVYKVTAAVMHMGELKFKNKGRDEQAEADEKDVNFCWLI